MKKLQIFKTMFVANFKEFIRDSSALFWMLAFPIIFTFIFGIVFSGGGEPSYSLGITGPQNAELVKHIEKGLAQIPTFNVTTGNREEELEALREGQRSLVIAIPESDMSKIQQGESLNVKIYYDAAQSNTNRALISAVNQVFAEIERQITNKPKVFEITSESVQTRQLTDFDYLLPGILAMALMQLGLFGVFQFMNLREQKVIRGLAVTPLPRSVIFQSEVLLRLITALVQTVLIVFVGWIVFGVEIVGNPLLVFGLVILGAMTFVSLGYMLASFANSLESGRNIIQLVQFPMMFLSGIFFPIDFMPDYIRPVVKAIPLTYLGDALRQTMVGAAPNHSLLLDVAVLGGWMIVSSVLAIRYWRWE